METLTINLPSIDQIKFEIIVEHEHVPVKGNALASGDDNEDRKAEEYIMRQLRNGNVWAWCSVEVKGTYKSLEASDYLGCCSYKNEKGFIDGGYYEDMRTTVHAMIIEQIKALGA